MLVVCRYDERSCVSRSCAAVGHWCWPHTTWQIPLLQRRLYQGPLTYIVYYVIMNNCTLIVSICTCTMYMVFTILQHITCCALGCYRQFRLTFKSTGSCSNQYAGKSELWLWFCNSIVKVLADYGLLWNSMMLFLL